MNVDAALFDQVLDKIAVGVNGSVAVASLVANWQVADAATESLVVTVFLPSNPMSSHLEHSTQPDCRWHREWCV
jgi:hypothetical protein